MNLRKYASFSLWGQQLKYTVGAVMNAQLVRYFLPGWTALFYVSSDVPKKVRQELEQYDAQVVDCRNENKIPPCMWRYLAHDIPDCERFISRDCDSRINERDKQLIDMWEASGRSVHFIQDHPGHKDTFLAGAWGCKTKFFGAPFRTLIEKYAAGNNDYGLDQQFIKHVLWPKARGNHLMSKDLTHKHIYVGQVYDENNNAVEWTFPEWSEWKKG